MKLMLYALDSCCETDLDGDFVTVLEIENPGCFSRIVQSFKGREIEPEEVALIDKDQKLSLQDECEVLFDYFDLDTSSKTIITKLYKMIADGYGLNIDLSMDFSNLNGQIESYIENLIENLDIDLQFSSDKLDIKDYLHLVKLTPKKSENALERLLDYIAIVGELKICRVLVLINPKSIFGGAEMREIYKFSLYHGVKLFIIEDTHNEDSLEYEKKIFIDSELFDMRF